MPYILKVDYKLVLIPAGQGRKLEMESGAHCTGQVCQNSPGALGQIWTAHLLAGLIQTRAQGSCKVMKVPALTRNTRQRQLQL